MTDQEQLLDARHIVANAAGSVAEVAAQIARALAHGSKPEHGAALISSLEGSIASLRRADRQLQEAVTRVRIALASTDH